MCSCSCHDGRNTACSTIDCCRNASLPPAGIATAFAGYGQSVWPTLEQAEASFAAPHVYDGIGRARQPSWLFRAALQGCE